MTPQQLKALAGVISSVATALEAAQVLPPGVAAAFGTVLTFLVGLWHPAPVARASRPPSE